MTQPSTDKSAIATLPGSNQVEVTDWFASQLRAALQNPLLYIPKTFETWMSDRVAVAGLDIPIGQIVGFAQFTAQTSAFAGGTDQTTTSTTYGDLGDGANLPSIDGLPDGKYLVLMKAVMRTTNTSDSASMSVSVNGAAASDNDSISTRNTNNATVSGFFLATLSAGGNNTLAAKYKTTSASVTVDFSARQLIALRYANP